jgi:hypothetical protein
MSGEPGAVRFIMYNSYAVAREGVATSWVQISELSLFSAEIPSQEGQIWGLQLASNKPSRGDCLQPVTHSMREKAVAQLEIHVGFLCAYLGQALGAHNLLSWLH